MSSVDARGLSCPQPAILARKAIEGGQFPIEVLVDSVTARENIRRLAENTGCKITVAQIEDEYRLTLNRWKRSNWSCRDLFR
jgi:tRNA 2-thiouridine synthesizing protein A